LKGLVKVGEGIKRFVLWQTDTGHPGEHRVSVPVDAQGI
jgi:hypothetical protein